jgi:rod shape-determining protein MreC
MAFRDGPFQDLKLPLTLAVVAATVVAILAALVLLIADRRAALAVSGFASARNVVARGLAPAGEVLEAPVRWAGDGIDAVGGYFFAVSENRRLKARIRDLETWRDEAVALRNVNERYEALLKLKTDPPAPFVAARSVLDVRGPFADARVLDAGAAAGVQVGDPVMSENGLVGRIVGVVPHASRVLMLTDVESRTPVLVDRTNARALLTGDGGPNPRLEYIRGQDPVKEGDVLLTSGDGGVFPRGLPVGVVAKDLRGAWRARLYSDLTPIDYVRILLFQDFAATVDPAALSAAAVPPLTVAEEADRALALAKATAPSAKTPAPDAKASPAAPPSATKPAKEPTVTPKAAPQAAPNTLASPTP